MHGPYNRTLHIYICQGMVHFPGGASASSIGMYGEVQCTYELARGIHTIEMEEIEQLHVSSEIYHFLQALKVPISK